MAFAEIGIFNGSGAFSSRRHLYTEDLGMEVYTIFGAKGLSLEWNGMGSGLFHLYEYLVWSISIALLSEA